MHNIHKHKAMLNRKSKKNNKSQAQVQGQQMANTSASRRHSLSNVSNERAQIWANNINMAACRQLINGAVREASTKKRQEFEVGNWQGQRLTSDLKYFDNVYTRAYQPDAV